MANMANQEWRCRLTASPERVREKDRVTLTVSLYLRNSEIPEKLYKCFDYRFDADDPRLNAYIQEHVNPPVIASIAGIIEELPSLPDDFYVIRVTATPNDKQIDELSAFSRELPGVELPGVLYGQTSISVITNLIQTQSSVTLQRSFAVPTDDMAMGPAIRNRTAAVGFDRYEKFINCVFCEDSQTLQNMPKRIPIPERCVDDGVELKLNIYGPYAYILLKLATQVFLTLESGVVIRDDQSSDRPRIFDIDKERIRFNDPSLTIDVLEERLSRYLLQPDGPPSALPYLKRIVRTLVDLDSKATEERLPYCHGILQYRFTAPSLIELIWSYWQEQGMLVQTMNAIAMRFQNRSASPNDPLGELEFDPLRPLNNLIWGFIQDEHNRLTVPRRACEYLHHYGLSLVGKTVTGLAPADVRSKFIEAFHNLLYRAAIFYREDSDTTVIADAFPLLNALKEVHLLLAEGFQNQALDLTWTARAEMLMTQWMLARPEMREFLRGRYMVPYQEAWMGAVDSMKKLQGWSDTSVTHFHELAVTGERILLSIRYGDWVDIENIEDQAKNWARSWKPEIQRYLHGYLTVSGVDLMADVTDSRDAAIRYQQPSVLLQRRLAQQRITMAPRAATAAVTAQVSGYAELPARGRGRLLDYGKQD